MASCAIDLSTLYATINSPATMPNFVRTDYGDPDGPPGGDGGPNDSNCAWSIRIFYNGTGYQFNWFFVGESMQIVSTFSQKGQATFTIADKNQISQVLPFVPVEEQYVEIWNLTEDALYFAGFIRDVDPTLLHVRDDLSESASYKITCTDLYGELERKHVREIYENQKLGFILKDVIRRYTTLDSSAIDATLGFSVVSYPINLKTPSQVLNDICQLLGATYWIDPTTRKIYITTKDSSESRFSLAVTDSNLYDTFDRDTFSLRRQTDMLKNAIELWFSQRYTAGTVNVATSSNIVVGYGATPLTAWDGLPANLQFKLAGSDAVYTVEKNNSVGATQELRLSSAFAESTATNQAYELRGNRTSVYLTDQESIGLMSKVRGDDGIFTYVVSEDENFFTTAEAYQFASALLSLSKPLPKGQGQTWNSVFQELPLQAGKTISFNLPISKRFVGNVVIQQITLVDEGGYVEIDGKVHPYLRIEMDFTATLSAQAAQLRKMMQDMRKVRVNPDGNEDIQFRAQIRETLALKDCIHVTEAIPLQEDMTLVDSITVRDVPDSPVLFYSDYDFVFSPFDISFTSD